MKVAFVIQGEGRGHMTQALAMSYLLGEAGHEVVAACVGTSGRRDIPSFFLDKIGAPIIRFRSPNFVTDPSNRGILIGATIWQNLLETDTYLESLKVLDGVVNEMAPDLVINFYEPLWGLYQFRHPGKVRSVCVAHQFLTGHQDFPFPEGWKVDRLMLQTLNSVTKKGSDRVLALSFTPMPQPDDPLLVVVPPLLRRAVFELAPTSGDFLLVYVMQSGYAEEIVAWHAKNPDIPLHCFWDRKDAPEVEQLDETLTFHQLSDVKFLEMMAGCRGLATTAGFESVCEAMYLGKPVFMVPVQGHFEQACNARDAERAGAGVWADSFDFDRFLAYLPHHEATTADFRAWADSAPEQIVAELERAVE